MVFENNPCLRLSWAKVLFGKPSLVVLHTWINRLDGTIGFVDRVMVKELNRHRFQFIPSVWEEPFGIVALEGIACGLIPIASDGGLPDAIGEAGVTFKRGQLAALVATTTRLVQSPELQAKCRRAAPQHLANFRSDAIKQEFLAALESVAAPRSRQAVK
ncbi:MAG TPA: glycosyltransferase [Hymenobacter sp.]|uniref:glycosyltransferase n=1 Tax=Hymenobacter sp. TaxID=1898978 RepID=UPI002ED904F8